jgi:N,N'-diacetylchitobiose phosphorylase
LIDLLLTGFVGVRPGLDGLRIEPCLPQHWSGDDVVADFVWRGAEWRVVLDPDAVELTVDGEPTTGLIAPAEPGTRHVVRVPSGHGSDTRKPKERMLHG